MKFDYDLSNNFFKLYNKAYGINSLKNILKSNPDKKIFGFFNLISIFFVSIFIIMYILYFIFNYYIVSDFSIYLFGICFLIVVIYFIIVFMFICNCLYYKKQLLNGTIELKDFGISNKNSKGFEIIVTYDKIDIIVITREVIVFLINDNGRVMFINNNIDIDSFTKFINKHSDALIINKIIK